MPPLTHTPLLLFHGPLLSSLTLAAEIKGSPVVHAICCFTLPLTRGNFSTRKGGESKGEEVI